MSWNLSARHWLISCMDTKPVSPMALQQQQMSEQIYAGGNAGSMTGWRCSSRIPEDVALDIYQRNLHVGVAQHLQTHFPVAHAYIGAQAYRMICAEYLKASPPDQPVFTIYAAHFPGFMLEYGDQNPQQLIWSVAAHLAQIDFFHHNAFCENQRIEVEDKYYQLWLSTKSATESGTPPDDDGLYRQLELHPERCQNEAGNNITLVTFLDNGELFFRVR